MTVSIVKVVTASQDYPRRYPTPLRVALEGLKVGQAVEVKGFSESAIDGIKASAARTTGRRFRKRLWSVGGAFHYLIWRAE